MPGDALARTMRSSQPGLRVVLMSGYGDQASPGETIPGARLLPKPFDIAVLRRELMDPVGQHTAPAAHQLAR